jgi:High potential iron-sulfur protein
MADDSRISRRHVLRAWMTGGVCTALASLQLPPARAADLPLLKPGEPSAKTLKYTEDGSQAKAVPADHRCATCALYQGAYGSQQGPCQIFPGRQVKAAGWCSSWEPQM